jgi:hypothetical protein
MINPQNPGTASRQPWYAGLARRRRDALPTLEIPGLVGWYRVGATEAGLTVVDESALTDLTAWSPYRLDPVDSLGDGLYELTCVSDGSPSTHYITHSTATREAGLVEVSVTVTGTEGTAIGGIRIRFSSSVYATWRLSDGAVLSSLGAWETPAAGTAIPGVGIRYTTRLFGAAGGSIYLYLSDATGNTSFTSAPTDKIFLRDFALTQRRLTSVANLVPGGPALAALTGTAPKLFDTIAKTWTGGEGFYARNAGYLRSAALGALFAGIDKPCTVYMAARNLRTAAGEAPWSMAGAAATSAHYTLASSSNLGGYRLDDDAGTPPVTAATAVKPAIGALYLLSDHFDGRTRTVRRDGITCTATVQGTGSALTATVASWGARAYGASSADLPACMQGRELIVIAGHVAPDSYWDRRIRRELAARHASPTWR